MTDDNQAMVDRVRKLFEKAAAVAGTPEADMFNAKAFELLAKYDLEEKVVRRSGVSDRVEDSKLIRVVFRFKDQYARERIQLIGNLAVALHCAGIFIDDRTGITVYGVKRHMDRIRLLNSYLAPQMLVGAGKSKPSGLNVFNPSAMLEHRKSYMNGFADSILYKVNEVEQSALRQRDMNAGNTKMALARQSDRERAQRALDKEYPPFMRNRADAGARGSGYAAGASAGRMADVGQTRVGAGGRRKLG